MSCPEDRLAVERLEAKGMARIVAARPGLERLQTSGKPCYGEGAEGKCGGWIGMAG
jgi:hypothetical protein